MPARARLSASLALVVASLALTHSAFGATPLSPTAGAVTSPAPVFVAKVTGGEEPLEFQVSTSPQITSTGFSDKIGFCFPSRSPANEPSCDLGEPLQDGVYYWTLLYQSNTRCVVVGGKQYCFPEPHVTKPIRFTVSSGSQPPSPPPPTIPPPSNPPPPTQPPSQPGSNAVLRPTDGGAFAFSSPEQTYSSTEAVVHYVTSGLDAPPLNDDNGDGVPDYVEQVGAAADLALTYYASHRFQIPPPDGAGPDGRLDIYIKHFQSPDLFGLTINPVDTPAGTFVIVSSHLDASPKIARGSIDTTVAHELFHVVQFGYLTGGNLPEWVAEGSATAMSLLVYPNIEDLTNADYLDEWLDQTWRPLYDEHSYCDHCYGGALWWDFLAEADSGLLPQYFERLSAMTEARTSFGLGIAALDKTLLARGDGSLADTFAYFSVALYRAGLRPAPAYTITAAANAKPRTVSLNGLSAHYVPIAVSRTATGIMVHVTTRSSERPRIALVIGGPRGRVVLADHARLRTKAERSHVMAIVTSTGPKAITYRIAASS